MEIEETGTIKEYVPRTPYSVIALAWRPPAGVKAGADRASQSLVELSIKGADHGSFA